MTHLSAMQLKYSSKVLVFIKGKLDSYTSLQFFNIYTDLWVRCNHVMVKWSTGNGLSLIWFRRLENLDEFILTETVSLLLQLPVIQRLSPPRVHHRWASISSGKRFLQHRQMDRHCLACVRRRQTVCLGTHTICSSLVSTSFPCIEALSASLFFLFQTKSNISGWGAAGERICQAWLSSYDFRYSRFTFCFMLALFLFLFFWLGSRQGHLRNPSAAGAWQWCTEGLGSRRWSYMGVLGWTVLKVTRNVWQLVFFKYIY